MFRDTNFGDAPSILLAGQGNTVISDRVVLRIMGIAAALVVSATVAFGQGKCRDGYGTQSCPLSADVATAPIKPVFAPTGWKTLALDHITLEMPDYHKEAAFYVALMGWK